MKDLVIWRRSSEVVRGANPAAQALDLLVSRRADVNAQDGDGQTPLHYAALSEHEQVSTVPLLIACRDHCNLTPTQPPQQALHLSASCQPDMRSGLLQACQALVKAGADAQLRDFSGSRPQDVDEHAASWDVWKAHRN